MFEEETVNNNYSNNFAKPLVENRIALGQLCLIHAPAPSIMSVALPGEIMIRANCAEVEKRPLWPARWTSARGANKSMRCHGNWKWRVDTPAPPSGTRSAPLRWKNYYGNVYMNANHPCTGWYGSLVLRQGHVLLENTQRRRKDRKKYSSE